MKARSRFRLLAIVLPALIVLVAAQSAMAQSGRLGGRVTEAKTGSPLPYANVVIVGTNMGGMTLTDGTFTIVGVPVGTYTIKVMMMGYKPLEQTGVKVNASQTTRVDFKLKEIIVGRTKEIVVEAEQVQIDVTSSDVKHSVSKDELEELPVDDVVEALALKGGIIKTGDELHVRGGRDGEVQFQIDGVPVDDPLGGGMIAVGMLGTDDSQVITGGMDAEYGNAQSAIVNISTREGGRTFEGQVRYMTDDFGRKDKTYTNYDRFSLGFGGPTGISNLTFYVSGEFTATDGENWANWSRGNHMANTPVSGYMSFAQRQSEAYNIQGKLAWQVKPGMKLIGEAIYSHRRSHGYSHNWNTEGYIQKIYRFTTLRASRESLADYARAFGPYVSVLHGPWIEMSESELMAMRISYYPGTLEERRRTIYPITIYTKVRDPNNPGAGAFLIRYDNFYARMVENIYGEETEIIWEEQVVNSQGQTDYQNKVLFEGFQNPDSKFSYFRNDSSFVYFNSAERTNVGLSNNLNLKVALNHNVNDNVLYTINLSRSQFDRTVSVIDPVTGEMKNPEDYLVAGTPAILPSGVFMLSGVSNSIFYTDPDYPYFVNAYDFPYYQDRSSVIYTMKADITSQQWVGHTFRTGIQFIYNDLEDRAINSPGSVRRLEDGSFMTGTSANIFHNFNPEASFYVQDKWEYQGMVVNAGLRFDFFSPGNNTEILINSSEIESNVEKYKFQISPRLGFAFPITDKDKFHFHYGRFTQWPSRTFLFRSQDMIFGAGVLGNPDLDEELTISYQAGVSHQFTQTVAANLVVFNKDIYGLISSTRVTDEDLGITGYRYINRTYASSRGVEISVNKRLSHHIGGEISYTWSFADGVASDANFGVTAEGLSHLPTQEMPLNWDQRHTLNVTLRLQDENKWGATVVYSFGSGLPWTPVDRFARRADPLWENTMRLDHTHVINLQGRKKFNIYGQELTLFFEGRNLLNDDVLLPFGTAPGANPGMVNARMDGGSYLTETGNFGGAYLQDLDQDGIDDFTPVNDPTIWASHRLWRIGFGFEF